MRRPTHDLGHDPVVGGRGQNDLTDGRGVIEDVTEGAAQPADLEGGSSAKGHLLAHGEQQLQTEQIVLILLRQQLRTDVLEGRQRHGSLALLENAQCTELAVAIQRAHRLCMPQRQSVILQQVLDFFPQRQEGEFPEGALP